MDIVIAKKIMGQDFLGPEELKKIGSGWLPDFTRQNFPRIPFSAEQLRESKKAGRILILGSATDNKGKSLTMSRMSEVFGFKNKGKKKDFKPRFFFRDWYLKEPFFTKRHLQRRWYLISKNVGAKTRKQDPALISKNLRPKESLPSAVLMTYVFFAYYLHTRGKHILFKHDFAWSWERDSRDAQVYTGRYIDPKRTPKEGFDIHRFLVIKHNYGAITTVSAT